MRKEVFLAIIFGIILGGILLFGINLANRAASNLTGGSATPTSDNQPTQTPTSRLSLSTPQNHSAVADKTLTLTGLALPNATLAIITELDDLLITSSPTGTFSAEINLESGENIITVTLLLPDQTTQTETLSVIQSNNLP